MHRASFYKTCSTPSAQLLQVLVICMLFKNVALPLPEQFVPDMIYTTSTNYLIVFLSSYRAHVCMLVCHTSSSPAAIASRMHETE